MTRLINADELIEVFRSLALMSGEYQESFTNVDGNRSMEIACAEDYVHKAKTIDAEPVKHAHWIIIDQQDANEKPDFRCSSCYCISPIWGYTRYCPNCGALMDGEIEEKRKK